MIVIVHVKAMKIYVAEVEAVRKKERHAESQHLMNKARD
jgi:hypothetical protein